MQSAIPMIRQWLRTCASTATRRSLAMLLVGVLVAAAYAQSGEFSTIVTLLTHGPQGANPASLVTASGTISGVAELDVGLSGQVAGSLRGSGGRVPVVGTLKVKGATAKLVLRSTSLPVVKFRGALTATAVVGPLTDRARRVGGSGTLTIDLSGAAPLIARVDLALRNGVGVARKGRARVIVEGETASLPATGRVFATETELSLRSGKLRFAASGSVEGANFVVSTFSMSACGVNVAGLGGTMSFAPNPPDVTLILVSGHPFACCASDAAPYLADEDDAGPAIVSELVRAGLSVQTTAFVDHHSGTIHGPGFTGLVETLGTVRDRDVLGRTFPTRIVVVAHSHGGVRAHQAIRAVPDVPVRLLVDLDTSSCSFNVGHVNEPTPNPVSAWSIGGQDFDDEDVVWPNVELNLEVSSNEICGGSILFELYEDSRNIRSSGTFSGLFVFDAHTTHSEVHDGDGATMGVVKRWILENL